VELCLFSLILVKKLLDFLFQLVLLLIQILNYGIILLLLIVVNGFKIGELLSESPELLDLRC
jgi:hypothetical protein